MGKKQDRSIQLTRIAIRDPGGKQRKLHPLVSRFLRLLFFLTGCFSIHLWFATLFQLPVSLEFLGISTLILGIWYFIAFFSKITRLICIPLSMGIMIFVLVRMWDELYRGIGQMVNTASQYIMDYYYTNLGFLPVEADSRSLMTALVLLEALLMMLLALSVLGRGKSRGLLAAGGVLLSMGLLVNQFPTPGAVLLWIFSYVTLCSMESPLKNQRVQRSLAGAGLGMAVFAAAMILVGWFLISPKLNEVMTAGYPAVKEFQEHLEDRAMEIFGGRSSGSWEGMVQNGVLSNRAPSGKNRTALSITADGQPEQAVYLKGFIGAIYQGTYWEEISDENFRRAVDEYYIYGLASSYYEEIDWTEVSYSVMQQYLTEGRYQSHSMTAEEDPLEFTMTYEDPGGEYVYAPYLSHLEEGNFEYYGDGEIRRVGQDPVRGSFYPEIPEPSQAGRDAYYETDPSAAAAYNQYLAEAYLYVPSQGLEELKSWWNRELSEYQEITGHYPTQEETTTLIRQALSECSYSLDLDPLPEGEDFVEYFVLHQKKGFCTHFASAAVLLYRLAGYPARYVTGYIAQPEEFEADGNGTYTAEVPGKNAHAWAEIYQGDGTGWVPVEMTPGYTEEEEVPVSPEEQEPSAAPSPTEVPEQEEEQGGADGPEQVKVSPGKLPPALIGVLAGTGAVLLLILTVILRRNLVIHMRLRKFKNKNRRRAVLSIVREADRMLFAAGFRTEGELSDREYAGKVQEAFPGLERKQFLRLMELGQRAAYSREHISAGTAAECLRIYGELEQELSRDRGRLWKFRWRFIKCYR